MVHLALLSLKANHGSRHFPHAGYLGLTPVKVEGVVRTRLDEDAKPARATAVTVAVRCYEARIGRLGVVQSNILFESSQTLWSKSPENDWEPLGDVELPFKFIISPDCTAPGSVVFPEYRIVWRIEATLVHEPSTAVGGRLCKVFPIPLIRYDNGPVISSPISSTPHISVSTSRSGKPLLQYSIQPPTYALGPLDLLPVQFSFSPLDPGVRIHSIHMQVERRIDLHEISASSGSSHVLDFLHRDFQSPPSPGESQELLLPPENSTLPRVPSQPTLPSTQSPTIPLSAGQSSKSQSSLSAKRSISTLSQMASDCSSAEVPNFSRTITMALPAAKSPSHWSNGVTLQTNLISVRFFLRTRLVVSHGHGSQETLDLDDRELYLIPTNQSERTVALTKYQAANPVSHRSRSSSKSPAGHSHRRRRREEADSDSGAGMSSSSNLLPNRTAEHASSSRSGSSRYGPSLKVPRRPHTSDGHRDASHPQSSFHRPGAFRMSFTTSRPSTSYSTPSPPAQQQPAPSDADLVRDWEEELEKITLQSRRRSALMKAFGRGPKRVDLGTGRSSPTPPRPVQVVQAS